MKRPKARPPTKAEVTLLFEFLLEDQYYEGLDACQEDRDTLAGHISGAGIAVIDSYITDGPGYAGRVMFVVWPAGPETHEVFTFTQTGIERRRQDWSLAKPNWTPVPRDEDMVVLLDGRTAEIVGQRAELFSEAWPFWAVTVMLRNMDRMEVQIEWDSHGEKSPQWKQVAHVAIEV